MKTLQIIGLTAALGFLASPLWAEDAEHDKPSSEAQLKQRSEIIAKYDADKDGVLSQQELKQLSKSDKQALARTGGVGTAKKAAKQGAQPKVKAELKPADHKSEHAETNVEVKGIKNENAPKGKGKK